MTDVATTVQAIVVHHNSPDTLGGTIDSLRAAGIRSDHLLVVDNSENRCLDEQNTHVSGVRVVHMENRGYAAAVNRGLEVLSESATLDLTLVCTHETIVSSKSIQLLAEVMLGDATIGAAGPTLLSENGSKVWSIGGELSPILRIPRHLRVDNSESRPAVDREWLDGALTLYRTQTIGQIQFDERYFLYFEETDLHVRLSRAGYRVVWVPDAIAQQESSGIPPRLLGRNLFLFHAINFTRTRGRCAVGYASGRALIRKVLTRRGRWSAPREILSGWREGERVDLEHHAAGEHGW